MSFSISEIFIILEQYKYWVIFPVVILEGPIIIIISGFLISLGVLQPITAFIVIVLADTTGDSISYSIGKLWRRSIRVKKYASFLGYSEKSEQFLESHFARHKIKTFLVAKFSYGIGRSIQIASGIAGVKYFEYLWINCIGTIPKTFILLVLGFYIGDSYAKINGYLEYIALSIVSIFVLTIFYFTTRKFVRDFLYKNTVD